ncbi:hypothetical protein BC567DRAFT_229653 [Phyllosticta citribraziliensis]
MHQGEGRVDESGERQRIHCRHMSSLQHTGRQSSPLQSPPPPSTESTSKSTSPHALHVKELSDFSLVSSATTSGQIRPANEAHVPCSRVRQHASDAQTTTPHDAEERASEREARHCAAPVRNARNRTPSSSGTPLARLVLRMVRRPPAKQN